MHRPEGSEFESHQGKQKIKLGDFKKPTKYGDLKNIKKWNCSHLLLEWYIYKSNKRWCWYNDHKSDTWTEKKPMYWSMATPSSANGPLQHQFESSSNKLELDNIWLSNSKEMLRAVQEKVVAWDKNQYLLNYLIYLKIMRVHPWRWAAYILHTFYVIAWDIYFSLRIDNSNFGTRAICTPRHDIQGLEHKTSRS